MHEPTNSQQPIPMFNPTKELEIIGYNNILAAINKVLSSGTYISGPAVGEFEDAIAQYSGCKYAIAVSSGTMALELCLRAVGLKSNEEVYINTNTFVAVAEAIIAAGGQPHLTDIDTDNWQMAEVSTSNLVLASHLFGNASAAINSQGKLLIEDASQSFGARLNGKLLGSFAPITAVSLYPTKNLSATGDAGVILTNSEAYATICKALRNHGQTGHQIHQHWGTTGRMDDVQASILLLKLKHFDQFLQQRRYLAGLYTSLLKNTPLQLPVVAPELEPATNLFVVRTKYRDELRAHLQNQKIATGVHYPTPIHKMPAYRGLPWSQQSLPNAELLANEILSLPLWVGMTAKEVERVCTEVSRFFDTHQ